ncbi:MAG TPA: chorismate-binding protein, partial [Streptosporangiaceae bacterium]|nr:chorismate-binding protein [Streptosporangiaceae bacterium]
MGPASPFRLVCQPLDWRMPAVDALRLLRGDAHPVALTGAWAGGSDVVCSEPAVICREPELPWDALGAAWPAAGPGRAGFGGGWIGYLGFGLAGEVLPVPPAPGGSRRLPSWWLGYYDHVLRRDRASGQWFFEALWTPGRAAVLHARLAQLRARASRRPRPRPFACGDFRLTPSAAEHRSAVRRAVEYVRQGDIFQANICLRLEAGFSGDPLDGFCEAVTRLDPPYAAFLGLADGAVASLSPELFLRRDGAAVASWPVKGTAGRPAEEQRAAAQLARLGRSAKNRAENVMIVDLVRSDLSRVCVPGSVRVPRLAAVQPHPGVWHLVSEVAGQLRPGTGDGELVRAAFPPGSVTGAPKVRALEVIHELEATPREVYTGAVGYRSPAA